MTLKPGIYKHYKGPVYQVLYVGKHTETEEEMVVYVELSDPQVWLRPLSMFQEDVIVDGVTKPRFKYEAEDIAAWLRLPEQKDSQSMEFYKAISKGEDKTDA